MRPYYLALLLILPLTAIANNQPLTYDRIDLQESATVDVDNDLLVAELFAQAEGRDAAAPANQVNQLVAWAIEQARRHDAVKLQTLGYNSNPMYKNSTIHGWRVSQSIRLESHDSSVLSDLIGELQAKLKVSSIGYQVSDQQRRKHLDDLTDDALRRFTERAARIARTLGHGGFRIVRLSINDDQPRPMPVARGMMMEAAGDRAVSAPQLEAGTRKLSVSIHGEIELDPK
ncbi:MAG: SIMPL domain-containing protein [Gammaproteobacteria bacterium]|nr:SIMPL domain-containing protein [Gammaproteobacteria bacterium]